MKKACFIIPYFGKLPNYFQLFLKSCASNTDYSWLIFTDDTTDFKYPNNVTRVLTSFEDIKKVFASKFNFKLALDTPYKFCDFKPTYGYVFENYLKDFLFWGYCDIDTLMGNLNDFLTDDFLSLYDKIFALGHMTLYRNTSENNKVFMRKYKGRLLYKEYLTNPKICVFDEDCNNEYNIHSIFKAEGKRVFEGDFSLNFDVNNLQFRRVHYVGLKKCPFSYGHMKESPQKTFCFWNQGAVERYSYEKDRFVKEEFLYIHLQMRRMYMMPNVQKANIIRISPNVFSPISNLNKTYLLNASLWVAYPGLLKLRISYFWRNFKNQVSQLLKVK